MASIRKLRLRHVHQGILAAKVILLAIAFGSVGFLIKDVVTSYLHRKATLEKFRGDLANNQPVTSSHESPTTIDRKAYSVIVERNIFGSIGSPIVAATPSVKPVSKVPLNLIGTFLSTKEPSSAIIEDTKKSQQDVFTIKESVFGVAKLVAVFRDRVEIDRDGTIEVLKLEDSSGSTKGSGGAPSGGNEITVDEKEVDQALSNLPLLLTEIRAVPYFKDGQAAGLRLFAIKTGSLFDKIGLKNGDILKSINGSSMGDFTQAVKLFEKLKAERSLSVLLERNKQELEYKYQIK